MSDMRKTPVFLSTEDWSIILREARDGRRMLLETERDHQERYPRVATAARVEAERIGAAIERLEAQVDE